MSAFSRPAVSVYRCFFYWPDTQAVDELRLTES